ncbi:ATP-binding protein [Micromonospora sp. NPDC005173]|uniref:sensor histidine kinase n=1 Tax=Micromonospora sp. NPDC005173 TaxID=3157165 RepID=UPI0033B94324
MAPVGGTDTDTITIRRDVIGSLAALACMGVLLAGMLPLRPHLSVATSALVLVVPVVLGVVLGGFRAGVVAVIAGFLVYDVLFIPPYMTLNVGAAENWTALAVYAAVLLPIARVVAGMNAARAKAQQRGMQIRELFAPSGLLVEDKPFDELKSMIVNTVRDVFDARQVVLLLPRENDLDIVASAGAPLTEEDRGKLIPAPGQLANLDSYPAIDKDRFGLALIAANRPVGLLVVSGQRLAKQEREPLLLFANQAALAIERAQLREHALRTELTEEVERLARMLVAAVSHDLRTPLASIKASSSILADPDLDIGRASQLELAELIDTQADRLAALVTNLLDMSRVQAGVLRPRYTVTTVADLVATVLRDLSPALGARLVRVNAPVDLPPIDIDLVLITRVLTNLLVNAARHGPGNTPITIDAELTSAGTITVAVTDRGPGVSPDRRSEIFGMYSRRPGDAGTGLGLTIAKAFIDAHEQRIWTEDAPQGGARFCFTLPVASPLPEEIHLVPHPDR